MPGQNKNSRKTISKKNIKRKTPKRLKKVIRKRKKIGGNVSNNEATQKNKQMCSPSNAYDDTCFTLDALKRIAKKLNVRLNDNNAKIKMTQNKKLLVKDINKKMCNKYDKIDFCILDNDKWQGDEEIKKIIRKTFKPPQPLGKSTWLNSIDIRDVMSQFEDVYPEFIFLGPVPIDFDDILTEVGNINLKKLSKQKKKIGIIFNTDPHNKPGEHWISMFIDLDNKSICFFDSTGDPPSKEIEKLINKLERQSKSLTINFTKFKTTKNKKQHQFNNSECGIYSLFFIIQRLAGNSCNNIFNTLIHDKKMNENREVFFTKQSDKKPVPKLLLESFSF